MNSSQDPFNRGGFFAFIFSMGFSVLFFLYLIFIHPQVDLKEVKLKEVSENPSLASGETQGPALDLSKVEKPWESSEGMIAEGKKAFTNTCAACHGPDGQANTPIAQSMNPPPRNLVKGEWKKGKGQAQDLFAVLQKGIDGTSMASFKHVDKNTRWAMVHFIRSITMNKIDDNPADLEAFAKQAE